MPRPEIWREESRKVPRITKTLPPLRADYSFGDLVYWHLFVYGTRPTGNPDAKIGRVWDQGAFCQLIDVTDRTLRNWIFDKHLPDNITALEDELFGNNPLFDDWRLELAEALRNTRKRKLRKSSPFQVKSGLPALFPNVSRQADDDGEDDDPSEPDNLPAGRAGDEADHTSSAGDHDDASGPSALPVRAGPSGYEKGSEQARRDRRGRTGRPHAAHGRAAPEPQYDRKTVRVGRRRACCRHRHVPLGPGTDGDEAG